MVLNSSRFEEINVLASEAGWAWPLALRDIFQPRGVNLLIAKAPDEFVGIIRQRRIHTAIVDTDTEKADGLATVRIIRMDYPALPCIMLSSNPGRNLLSEALLLEVFSVIEKPVDMDVLRRQLDRLFIKRYNSDIFS